MMGYRIIATVKEQHFAYAEKVEVRGEPYIADVERIEVIDPKGRAWYEPVISIVYNPKIIKEVSAPWLYKIDLTEVRDNASE